MISVKISDDRTDHRPSTAPQPDPAISKSVSRPVGARRAESSPGSPTSAVARDRGHTQWSRFTALLLPSLLAVLLLGVSAASGAIPIALAGPARHALKISMTSLTARSATTGPQRYQTRDGQRHTEVVVELRGLRVNGLCASLRVPTPLGAYVLRITGPHADLTLTADDLTFALDNLDGLGVLGRQLSLHSAESTLNGPLTHTSDPGFLPIQLGNMTLNIAITLRWITARNPHLRVLTLAGGRRQRECF